MLILPPVLKKVLDDQKTIVDQLVYFQLCLSLKFSEITIKTNNYVYGRITL